MRTAETVRLLRSPLAHTLLGDAVTMDLLARNGFRFLGVPAWVDRAALSSRVQRFRNTSRVDPTLARRESIRTISDSQLDAESVLREVTRLENPRHRFAAELFWPHVGESDFETIQHAGDLGSAEVLRACSASSRVRLDRALRAHARAIAHSCQAIEAELDFLEKLAGPPHGKWEEAIESWRGVWRSEEFWAYLRTRVDALDDPRLLHQDVDRARADLPGVLLGVQELLAERYASDEDYGNCVRHLNLIHESGFGDERIRAATWNAVKKVAGARLEDLQRRAKQTIADLPEDSSRQAFEAAVGPFIREAGDIQRLLSDRLQLPAEFLEQSAFDQFAEQIQKAANKKINYSDDERERNLLYCSMISKRLLSLPLSAGCRRTIEQSIRNDNRILYSTYGIAPADCPEALKCFFIDEADSCPDASLIIRMHRITSRRVEVNHASGSGGVQVHWEKARLLVPRSTLAQQHSNGGRVDIPIPEADYTPRQRESAATLENLEKAHRARQDTLRAAGDAEIRAEEHRRDDEIQAAGTRIGAALTKVRQAVTKESAGEKSQLQAETQRLGVDRKRAESAHEPAIETAKAKATHRKRQVSGVRGVLRIEMPVLCVACLAAWLATSDVGGIAISGALVAVVTGKVVRRMIVSSVDRVVASAERARDVEVAGVVEASGKKEKEIRRAAESRRRTLKANGDALEVEKKRIGEAAQKRVDLVRQGVEEKRRQQEVAFAERTKTLRADLVRSVQVKKESQKNQFPACRAAKSKGFKEGTKPSSSDMQMTDAERFEVMMRLRAGF